MQEINPSDPTKYESSNLSCRLFGTKPLSKPMVAYCWLHPPWEVSHGGCQTRKSIWKGLVQNGAILSWRQCVNRRQSLCFLTGDVLGDSANQEDIFWHTYEYFCNKARNDLFLGGGGGGGDGGDAVIWRLTNKSSNLNHVWVWLGGGGIKEALLNRLINFY